MRRTIRVLLLACALVVGASAQQDPDARAGIEAVVLDGVTDAPLSGVRVRIGDTGFTATTDAEGWFVLNGFTPGSYTVTAEKPGYMTARMDGLTLPGSDGLPVTFAPGAVLRGVLRLYPAAVMSGRVLDRRGRPFQGVTVVAVGYVYGDSGERRTRDFGRVRTNDLGEYRFTDLDAGAYGLRFERTRFLGGVPDSMYPLLYYPGTTDLERATWVEAGSGTVTEVDPVTLYEAPGGVVRVRVSGAAASGSSTVVRVRLTQNGLIVDSVDALVNDIPAIGPLPQGTYELDVATSSGEVGGTRVEVRSGDVDINVALAAEAGVAGGVIWELEGGEPSRTAAGIRIEFIDRTPWGRAFRAPRSVISGEDGSFRMGAVRGGLYFVRVAAPRGTYVRTIRDGSRDVLRDGLVVDGNEASLSVVLGGPASVIEGTALDTAGRVVPAGIVALVPENPADIHLFRETRTVSNGTFRFEDVTPGGYALYAWRELPGAAYRNAEFMDAYASMGYPVTVESGDQLAMDIDVLEP